MGRCSLSLSSHTLIFSLALSSPSLPLFSLSHSPPSLSFLALSHLFRKPLHPPPSPRSSLLSVHLTLIQNYFLKYSHFGSGLHLLLSICHQTLPSFRFLNTLLTVSSTRSIECDYLMILDGQRPPQRSRGGCRSERTFLTTTEPLAKIRQRNHKETHLHANMAWL